MPDDPQQQGLDDILGAKDFYSVPVPEQLKRLRTNKNFSALTPQQQGAYLYRAKAAQIPEKGYQDEVNPPQAAEPSFGRRAVQSFFRTYSPQFFPGQPQQDTRTKEESAQAGYTPGSSISNIFRHTGEEAEGMVKGALPYYLHPIDSFSKDPAGTVAAWSGLTGGVREGWRRLPEEVKRNPSLIPKTIWGGTTGAVRGALTPSKGDLPSLGLGYPGYHLGRYITGSELGGAVTSAAATRIPAAVSGMVRGAREAYTGVPSEVGFKPVTISDLQNAVKSGSMTLDEFDEALKNKNLRLSTPKRDILSRTMRSQMAQKEASGAAQTGQTPAQLKANQALAKEAQVRTQREASARARGEASQVSEQEAARARNEALARQGATRTQREATARTGAEESQVSEQEAAQRRNEALAREAASRTKSEATGRTREEAAQSSQEDINRRANEVLAKAAEARTRREAAAKAAAEKAKAKGEKGKVDPPPPRKVPPPPSRPIGGGSEGGPFDAPVEPSKDWEEKGMQQKMREGAEKFTAPASGRDPFSGRFEQVGKYGDVPRAEPTEQQITDWQAPYRAAKELTLARHLVSTGVDLSEIKYTKEYAKAISKEAGLKYEASEQTLNGAIKRARQMQDTGGPIHIEYEKPLDVEAPKEKTGLEKRRETQRGSFSLKPKEPMSERAKRAQSLIQSRDRLFHQIDMDNLQSALQNGIKFRSHSPEDMLDMMGDIKDIKAREGVSMSRVPAHGAGSAMSYVTGRPSTLEVAKGEVPTTRPIAEGGFQKTRYREITTSEQNNLNMLDRAADEIHRKMMDGIHKMDTAEWQNIYHDYKVAADKADAYRNQVYRRMHNPYFEYEERTKGKNVPPNAIKAVHLDLEKLRMRYGSGFQRYWTDHAKTLTDATNKPLVIHDTTREMKSYLASKAKLPTLFAKGGTIKHPTRGIVGEAGPELVDKGTSMELVLHPKLMGLGKGYKVTPL